MMGKLIFSNQSIIKFWHYFINWTTFLVIILYIFRYLTSSEWMYYSIYDLGGNSVTPISLILIIFTVFVAFRFSKVLRHNVLSKLYDHYGIEKSNRATINTLLHYFILIIAFLFSISTLGFDLASLSVFAGVLGIGLGFGLKNIMNNFISGLIILFDRPIKVGDRVIIKDTFVDIEQVRIRNTIVKTRLNERIVVPNAYFLENDFINRSYTNKKLRVTVSLTVPFGEDIIKVEELMIRAVYDVREEKWLEMMSNPQPKVFIEDFGEYSITCTIYWYIDKQSGELEFLIPSDVRKQIYHLFRENDIKFSYPYYQIELQKN